MRSFLLTALLCSGIGACSGPACSRYDGSPALQLITGSIASIIGSLAIEKRGVSLHLVEEKTDAVRAIFRIETLERGGFYLGVAIGETGSIGTFAIDTREEKVLDLLGLERPAAYRRCDGFDDDLAFEAPFFVREVLGLFSAPGLLSARNAADLAPSAPEVAPLVSSSAANPETTPIVRITPEMLLSNPKNAYDPSRVSKVSAPKPGLAQTFDLASSSLGEARDHSAPSQAPGDRIQMSIENDKVRSALGRMAPTVMEREIVVNAA